jgi:hypothetical protein
VHGVFTRIRSGATAMALYGARLDLQALYDGSAHWW